MNKKRFYGAVIGVLGIIMILKAGGFLLALGIGVVIWGNNLEIVGKLEEKNHGS